MNNPLDSKLKMKEIMLWLGVVVITIASFFVTYRLDFSAPILAFMWIGWLVFTLVLVYFTETGNRIFSFGKEAKVELEKVVWPNRQETIQTTSIVMIMVTVTGFILWGVDSSMMWAIGKITHLG